MTKKRHHYIPKAYLKAFCDGDGRLYIYRKDDPEKEIRLTPENVAFQKYFYSQPIPGGGRDHNKLEDLFCEYEASWPGLVQRFRAGENVNCRLDYIFASIALQRARVPAARDACETVLRDIVKARMRRMEDTGELPPPPKGSDVAIDPHQSIHSMVDIVRGTGTVLSRIGIGVVHNKTDVPFVTSDNPVIWFDPSLPDSEMRPYSVRADGPIMLLFPIAPDLMIYGDSTMQQQFARDGLTHRDPRDAEAVRTMNRLVCQFAYETVFADRAGYGGLVKEYANVSPVIRTEAIPAPDGQYLLQQYVWGERTRKPKWTRDG